MKIIDFEPKGNVIRFKLGKSDLESWWGDDWNDIPYEHNAEEVYSDYVSGIMDIFVPWDWCVLFPADGEDNSPYSKEDMMKKKIPCALLVPPTEFEYQWEVWKFRDWVGNSRVMKIYMGDPMTEVWGMVHEAGGFYRVRDAG